MAIGRIHSWKKVAAQVILLDVPTCMLAFYMLWDVNHFYQILQNQWIEQGCYFGAGITLAIIFYGYRFRFITTASLLFLIYYGAYKLLGKVTVGEFDAFFASVQFLIFTTLFSVAWISGYGFSRSRYFTIFWSLFLLCMQIIVVSRTTNITANTLISAFAPVLAYSFYIIYTAELIRNMNEDQTSFGWFILKRMLGFSVVVMLLLLGIFSFFKQEFSTLEKEWGHTQANYDKNKSNSESMTKDNRDGSIGNKDQTQLTGSLNKGKRLVFVSRLDNFFNDGITPNPLYFTAYFFTKFDTLTQTFERDNLMPDNDLFRPDPSKIPLYFAKADSNIIRNTHATIARKVVNSEVYKVLLSPDEYVAPSTSFFCQPIPVPNEYKDTYKSAYRAKMWVSDLNSAYFIYNPAGNKMLEDFQKQRFDVLRKVKDFSKVDKKFLDYYTFMPSNDDYDSIRILAKQITANATTPVDKMIAIRDYFLSKDEFGQPLFKYSDNPGIPGLPSASKLNYFLFDNRKGYCAYFAGATLFMLRALGIPSRVAAGFLTVDRSSKNPGWYWFYEDQAHAWVQAFFPGYGWIDFDTTVPDANTQQSPQPDGTPPLNLQQPYFVADGMVKYIDTIKKRLTLEVKKVLFRDKDFETAIAQPLELDISLATVSRDTGTVPLSSITKDMHITAASYAETLKNIKAYDNDSVSSLLKKLPKPVPADEIKIIEPESKEQQKKKETQTISEPIDWIKLMWIVLVIIAGITFITFSLPWIIIQYYNTTATFAKDTKDKAFKIYRATMFYLNQLGYYRTNMGPGQYASSIDKIFSTKFDDFSNVYQRLKYSSIRITETEKNTVNEFYQPFVKQVHRQIPFKTRFSKFLNIYNTIHFYTQPKIS